MIGLRRLTEPTFGAQSPADLRILAPLRIAVIGLYVLFALFGAFGPWRPLLVVAVTVGPIVVVGFEILQVRVRRDPEARDLEAAEEPLLERPVTVAYTAANG